jgi:hypothetical protein
LYLRIVFLRIRFLTLGSAAVQPQEFEMTFVKDPLLRGLFGSPPDPTGREITIARREY